MLAVLGVWADGLNVLLDLRLAGDQSTAAWRDTIRSLVERHLGTPRAQWRALLTTNALERIKEELRRRTKTQATLPSQGAVLLVLFGSLRSVQIRLRAIDEWQEMRAVRAAG